MVANKQHINVIKHFKKNSKNFNPRDNLKPTIYQQQGSKGIKKRPVIQSSEDTDLIVYASESVCCQFKSNTNGSLG